MSMPSCPSLTSSPSSRRLFSLILEEDLGGREFLGRTTSRARRRVGPSLLRESRETAVISRRASAEGRNAIMCRLYATIMARAHGAERRQNLRRDPINRPWWAP